MANLTDPLIRSIKGQDPQNLMEYITRQKIYDSRYWKEDCFGLTTADVIEKAVKTINNVGGNFGGNSRPTKFLCLILKLLQLQPDTDLIIEQYIHQKHFKYLRALGVFYLRLTGRPADIYETLEPLYEDYRKLRYRGTTSWSIQHMDEYIHELLTQPFCCGIALPRLPYRTTLQEDGLLDDGPRPTALQKQIEKVAAIAASASTTTTASAGGDDSDDDHDDDDKNNQTNNNALEALLLYKVNVEKSPAAIALWEKRNKKKRKNDGSNNNNNNNETRKNKKKEKAPSTDDKQQQSDEAVDVEEEEEEGELTTETFSRDTRKRKYDNNVDDVDDDGSDDRDEKKQQQKKKKKKKERSYGNLFKKDSSSSSKKKKKDDSTRRNKEEGEIEGSDEYWDNQRAKLGLKPLRR